MDDRLKEAAELLALHDAARNHNPNLKGLADLTMAKLQEINQEIEAGRPKPGRVARPQQLHAEPVEPADETDNGRRDI